MNFEDWCWFTGLIMVMAFLVNNDLIFFGVLGCISILISAIFTIIIKSHRKKK